MFTFNEATQKDCELYGDEARLMPCSNPLTKTYVMYTTGNFGPPRLPEGYDHAILRDEGNALPSQLFDRKSLPECAALCDEWFGCLSFRADDATGSCRLFQSEQYAATDESTLTSAGIIGTLYTYRSESYYVQLPSSFCVPAISFISVAPDTPLEACKTLCDKIPTCLSFEHDQDGKCSLYGSSDFSATCGADQGRSLYVGYGEIFDENRDAFSFKELQNCFDLSQLNNTAANVTSTSCHDECLTRTGCYGVQHNEMTKTCTFLEGDLPAQASCGDSTAFLGIEVDPYRLVSKPQI